MANWIVSDMKGCEVKLLFFGDAAVKVINFPVTALIHFRNATLMKVQRSILFYVFFIFFFSSRKQTQRGRIRGKRRFASESPRPTRWTRLATSRTSGYANSLVKSSAKTTSSKSKTIQVPFLCTSNTFFFSGSTRHCVYHIAAELKKIQHSRSEFRNP